MQGTGFIEGKVPEIVGVKESHWTRYKMQSCIYCSTDQLIRQPYLPRGFPPVSIAIDSCRAVEY